MAAAKKNAGPDFAVGEVWAYRTRRGEEQSKVQIKLIEEHPKLGIVFHVGLTNLRIKGPEGFLCTITHVPLSAAAFAQSVTARIATDPVDEDYREGYEEWRAAENAGIFMLPLSEIVGYLESAIAEG